MLYIFFFNLIRQSSQRLNSTKKDPKAKKTMILNKSLKQLKFSD